MWCNYNREVRNKFITLSWVLRIYKDVKHNRIPGLEGIKTCILLSPSKIEQQELKNMAARLSRIDDESLLESAIATNEDVKLLKSVRAGITDKPLFRYGQLNLLECIQDDIDRMILEKDNYNEPDGLSDLLHCMNKKMACIKDYVDTDKTLNKDEFKQWNAMYQNLDRMRKDVSNGRLYNEGKSLINTYTKFGDQ